MKDLSPSHMVWSATPVAFDGGQSRGIEPTTRWGSARSEGPLTPGEPGAVPGEMADTTTVLMRKKTSLEFTSELRGNR